MKKIIFAAILTFAVVVPSFAIASEACHVTLFGIDCRPQ